MLKTIETEQMSPTYLTQVELAVRWRISPRTLERWRWAGDGPRFIKIGGLVRYRLEDIEVFESNQLRQITGTEQSKLAPAKRIAPLVRSRRKKIIYAELRSFLLNGRRSVARQYAATRGITQYYDKLKLWLPRTWECLT